MNERDIAHRLIFALDESLDGLKPSVVARLQAGRNHALSMQKTASTSLSTSLWLAGAVGNLRYEFGRLTQGAGMFATVVLFAVAAHFWGQLHTEAEIDEVDVALLSDDLPINAYLDRGFTAWLNDSKAL
jgi:hypothetical protein